MLDLTWLLPIAFGVGALIGAVGIGGALLIPALDALAALTDLLLVLVGFPALVSIGVSQVIQIVAAISGTLGNLRYGTIDFGVAAVVTVVELAGVLVGVRIAHAVDATVLRKCVAVLCLV